MTKDEIIEWGKKYGWVYLYNRYSWSLFKQHGDNVLRLYFKHMKVQLDLSDGQDKYLKIGSCYYKQVSAEGKILRGLNMSLVLRLGKSWDAMRKAHGKDKNYVIVGTDKKMWSNTLGIYRTQK